jgi:trehalose operon repressor
VATAKYEEIYSALRTGIERGEYPFLSFLPSENSLAHDFGISRNTVRKALQYLASQGYVQAMQGRGIQVIFRQHHQTSHFLLTGIESLAEAGRRLGIEVRTRLLESSMMTVDADLAGRSGLPEGASALALTRLRLLDGRPAIMDRNIFLTEVVPQIPTKAAESSVYAYLENRLGVGIVSSCRLATIEPADEEDLQYLDLSGLDCVGVVESFSFDSAGVPFEYTRSRHAPRTFSFISTAQRLPAQR